MAPVGRLDGPEDGAVERRSAAVARSLHSDLSPELRPTTRFWDGRFVPDPDFVEPLWESLPATVRGQLSGLDSLPGPRIASYVVPETRRRGTAYVEVASGWLLHVSGVFVAQAERSLLPLDERRYRPNGEWRTSYQRVDATRFRLKRGRFPPEASTSGITLDAVLGDVNVGTDLGTLWRSIPERPRRLLAEIKETYRDHGDWWMLHDGAELTLTLRYHRSTQEELCGLSQTMVLATPVGKVRAEEMLRRFARATWDVAVFSAQLGEARSASDAIEGGRRRLGHSGQGR